MQELSKLADEILTLQMMVCLVPDLGDFQESLLYLSHQLFGQDLQRPMSKKLLALAKKAGHCHCPYSNRLCDSEHCLKAAHVEQLPYNGIAFVSLQAKSLEPQLKILTLIQVALLFHGLWFLFADIVRVWCTRAPTRRSARIALSQSSPFPPAAKAQHKPQ